MSHILEKSWIEGIKGVLTSSKGVFSVFIVLVSAVLAILGHLSPSFAAVIGSAQVIFCTTHAYMNGKQMESTTTLQSQLLVGSSSATASDVLKRAVSEIKKEV